MIFHYLNISISDVFCIVWLSLTSSPLASHHSRLESRIEYCVLPVTSAPFTIKNDI